MVKLKFQLEEQGLKANDITFNTMIDACVKANSIELCFKLYEEMQEKGIKPDVFTYSSLIKAIKWGGGEGNIKKILEILEKVKVLKKIMVFY